MKTATITETKNGLSSLIDRVRGGESILILDRGVPVARLEPVTGDFGAPGRVQRLERAGVLRSARHAMPVEELTQPGPELRAGSSAVAAVIDERRSGR